MFQFFKFEVVRWLRTPMVWIFLGVITLLVFGAVSSDNVVIGSGIGNVNKNAPFVIQQWYGIMSLICLLMTTAFMNATATRDYSTGMYQFVFTSPIYKRDYFFGKFLGAFVISLIPMLGVSFGVIIGTAMPWVDEEQVGPLVWSGHLVGFLGFAVFNTFISGVILYGLAIIFRSSLVSFVGAMTILVLYGIAGGFLEEMDREWLAALLDPFGYHPFSEATKYMTVVEKNEIGLGFKGDFLNNRLTWLGAAMVLLWGIYKSFSFSGTSLKWGRKMAKSSQQITAPKHFPKSKASVEKRVGFRLQTLLHLIRFETEAVIKNQAFVIIVLIGMINLVVSLTSFTGSYGTSFYPVTYDVAGTIDSVLSIFIMAIITFYSGVLVWRDRDAKIADIEDVTPSLLSMRFFAKIAGLMLGILAIFLISIVVGVIAQAAYGYFNFEPRVYFTILLGIEWPKYLFLVSLAVLVHYLVLNRYLGYFIFVGLVIVNSFIWGLLELSSNMLSFGSLPWYLYSDMNGLGPFVPGLLGFFVYWFLFCLLLCAVAYAFMPQGTETHFKARWATAKKRVGQNRSLFATLLLVFVGYAGFTYYNTQILNENRSPKTYEQLVVDYELTYKHLEATPQPRWIALDYEIDIYPYERNLNYRIAGWVANKTEGPIDSLLFALPGMPDTLEIHIAGATPLVLDDRLNFRIYQLDPPLQPGDSLAITLVGRLESRGFENNVSFTSLNNNGTFFNNFSLLPTIGYDPDRELGSKTKRKKRNLPEKKRLPELEPDNLDARMHTYISQDADWVRVTTTITTAEDQIAVAPGSLKSQWQSNGRAGFRYELDHISLNFYSFISAKYEVARERWNDVDLEVYYIPKHHYNVQTMLNSIRASLEYYTENFGPYYHKQCRIIEFPRYSSFAQAFPGTMPYSEGLGFITDLRKVTEDDIDVVYYIVAHEMAHQYWAHQVIGAKMRGSEMLSESFAQYSALMVMERAYGRDKMKKFLKYEMDRYLSGRANEQRAERALRETENQGYIHYAKGSVVMYYLKEMIGEEAINDALRQLIADYGYQDPPWPTAQHAVDAFRARTPDSLQYLIADLFENITLFSNRVLTATATQVGEQWEVTMTTRSEKWVADTLGREEPLPLADWIDVAVFGTGKSKEAPGAPLVYERRLVTSQEQTFVFLVDEKPGFAGIDPYNYLVDRVPEDNLAVVKFTR
jgi:ABC-2 type transport system permease protein